MSNAAKQREVVQLLRFYGDWHGPYGGAGVPNLESLGQFGPAGMIFAGMAFDEKCWSLLEESYRDLEHALVLLKRDHFEAWLLLKRPYTGDPGDPRIVEEWREKRPSLMRWHDYATGKLAGYLRFVDLYVPWSSRKQTCKPRTIKEMNDAFIEDYQKLRGDGLSKTKAIQTAAEWNDYGLTRAWEIVKLREGKKVGA